MMTLVTQQLMQVQDNTGVRVMDSMVSKGLRTSLEVVEASSSSLILMTLEEEQNPLLINTALL